MERPEVAVVIPAFRAASTLRRAVASVCGASDVVVVFDGADAEAEREIAGLPVRIAHMPAGSGAPACRNAGLSQTDAPFVMFLDADDYVDGPLLDGAARAAEPADVVLAPFAFEYADGSRKICDPRLRYRAAEPQALLRAWLAENYTPPCAVLWRREFLLALGGWDETIAKNQDGDLVYRALARRPRLAFSSGGLGIYVQSDDPRRITKRHDARAIGSQLRVLDRTQPLAVELGCEAELSRAYYSLARLAFTHGQDGVGARAEAAARALGLAEHPGDFAHRALSNILGLRGKQRLARFARSAAEVGVVLKERAWPNRHSSASIGAPPPSAPISPTQTAAPSTLWPMARARSR